MEKDNKIVLALCVAGFIGVIINDLIKHYL